MRCFFLFCACVGCGSTTSYACEFILFENIPPVVSYSFKRVFFIEEGLKQSARSHFGSVSFFLRTIFLIMASNLVRGGAPVPLDLMIICKRVSRSVQQTSDVELLCCDNAGTACTVKVPSLGDFDDEDYADEPAATEEEEMRIHPTDKQKNAYTKAEFKNLCGACVERMWFETKAATKRPVTPRVAPNGTAKRARQQ